MKPVDPVSIIVDAKRTKHSDVEVREKGDQQHQTTKWCYSTRVREARNDLQRRVEHLSTIGNYGGFERNREADENVSLPVIKAKSKKQIGVCAAEFPNKLKEAVRQMWARSVGAEQTV